MQVWPYIRPLKRWINKRRRDQPLWDCPLNTAPAAATLAALSLPSAHSSSQYSQPDPLLQYAAASAAHHQQQQQQHGVDRGGRSVPLSDPQYSGSTPALSSMGSGGSSTAGGGGGGGAADGAGAGAAAAAGGGQTRRGLFKFDQAAIMRALLSGAGVVR